MLCCAGLFAGVIIGAYLGIPWAFYFTIPLGVAGGLLGDITIFRALRRRRKANLPMSDGQCCGRFTSASKYPEKASGNYSEG